MRRLSAPVVELFSGNRRGEDYDGRRGATGERSATCREEGDRQAASLGVVWVTSGGEGFLCFVEDRQVLPKINQAGG